MFLIKSLISSLLIHIKYYLEIKICHILELLKIISLSALFCSSILINAQTELKLGILPIVPSSLNLQIERGIGNRESFFAEINTRPWGYNLWNNKNTGSTLTTLHTTIGGRYYFSPKLGLDRFYGSLGIGHMMTDNGQTRINDFAIPATLGYKRSLFKSKNFFCEIEYGILWLPTYETRIFRHLIYDGAGFLLNNGNIYDILKLKVNYRF